VPSQIFQPGPLDGQVAIVSGGGSGLGRATALELAELGARAAVENLTRVLAIEWARFGIRLTALAAGHFATDTLMTKYPRPVVEGVAATVPLGRLGRPEEFAWLVAYVASPAGDYLSGAVLTLDGARDDWLGPWPPPGLIDERGKPLAEERRPGA
jgi:citronellol/citronellal dehydrogenase